MAVGTPTDWFENFFKFFEAIAIPRWFVGTLLALFVFGVLLAIAFPLFVTSFGFVPFILIVAGPIALPLFLGQWFFEEWFGHKRNQYVVQQKGILLELRLPRDVRRTPLAMETVLKQLHQPSNPTFIGGFFEGRTRVWYSLELVSIAGDIRFYIWTWPRFKEIIESQIYAQYPEAEVLEVPETNDYVNAVDMKTHDVFASNIKLAGKDAYPIMTYIDYGMDKAAPPSPPGGGGSEQVDPISNTLEVLALMKEGENMWLQIMIRPHAAYKRTGGYFKQIPNWVKEAQDEIKAIHKNALFAVKDEPEEGKKPQDRPQRLTKGEEKKVEAIERSLGKLPFETMIRVIYAAPKDKYNGGRISLALNILKQYNSEDLNKFVPGSNTTIDYWWQDPFGVKIPAMKADMLEYYKRRLAFAPHDDYNTPYILTTEEIATIFHPPASSVRTPTLIRTPTVTGNAPSNLPV